jgi:AraC-like DNA-binding protein
MKNIIREITPLTKDGFFIVHNHPNAKFDFPTHYHPEYEINYVEKAKGKRIVGEAINTYDGVDLVITGPNVYHSWQSETGDAELVVTIQFQEEFLPDTFQDKRLFTPIKALLENSSRGISFGKDAIELLAPKIKSLQNQNGFKSFLDFLAILNEMAVTKDQKILCSQTFTSDQDIYKSRRIRMACDYINKNYVNKIMISEVADKVGMTNSSFCHFFKKRTGKSFVEYLNDVRIGHATLQLIETTKPITEVCFTSGFNNISNFNRFFKGRKGITPSDFRAFNQQQISNY